MSAQPNWLRLQIIIFSRFVEQRLNQSGIKKEIKNILDDVKDGVVLAELLESLSGEAYPAKAKLKPQTTRMKQIDQVSGVLKWIEGPLRVDTKKCSTENVVDGDDRAVFGMLFSIIMKYMKLDDDEDDDPAAAAMKSPRASDLRDSLMLWFKNKTRGNAKVELKSFKSSFNDGVALLAVIHKMRPRLVDMDAVRKTEGAKNLEQALDIGAKYCNVPKYLTPADIPQLDEIAMVIYLLDWYFGCVLLQKQDVAGRRIGKLINMTKLHDKMRAEYTANATALIAWTESETARIDAIEFDNTLDGIRARLAAFAAYKAEQKSQKVAAALDSAALFNNLAMRLQNNARPPFAPPSCAPADVDAAFDRLEAAERRRSIAMQDELARQLRLDKAARRHAAERARLDEWLDGEDQYAAVVESASLTDDAIDLLDAHTRREKDAANMAATRLADLRDLAARLDADNYHRKADIAAAVADVERRFAALAAAEATKRAALEALVAEQKAADDAACKKYAELVDAFMASMSARKQALQASQAALDAQLADVVGQFANTSEQDGQLDAIAAAQAAIDARAVVANPHSTTMVDDCRATAASYLVLLAKKKELVEQQIEEAKSGGMTPEQMKEIDDNFVFFDKDKSGNISKRELRNCLQSLGEPSTPADVDKMFALVDTDKSGVIGRDEFTRLMVDKLRDTNTHDEIIDGFRLIALDEPLVKMAQLDILVNDVSWTQAHVAYLRDENPDVKPSGDQFDYATWTKAVFDR